MKEQATSVILNGTELRVTLKEKDGVEKEESYTLRKVSEGELEQLRKSGKPGFIFKKYNEYYYTELGIKFNLYNNKFCMHLCGACQNCRPSQCPKVWDRGEDKKIENYNFIAIGAETINLKEYQSSFVVKSCVGYIPY